MSEQSPGPSPRTFHPQAAPVPAWTTPVASPRSTRVRPVSRSRRHIDTEVIIAALVLIALAIAVVIGFATL